MSDHRHALVKLVRSQGWTVGAELGVDKGILFRMLLDGVPDLHLTGVDVFPIPERRDKVYGIAAQYPERTRLLHMTTNEAADLVPDAYLDFVFIDADHSYAAVVEDIARWAPKVKRGGWVGGHDYHARKWPGVVKAVDRAYGSRVQFWPGTIWGLWP